MGFYDAFFGSDQSLYTAYAIIAAIIAICVTILFTSTDIPVGSRLLMILFVVITLVPSIFLTLFEITCIVTGGTEPNNWWCYTFAWILAAFIIIYCIFVVIISIISLVTYNNAMDNINNDEEKNKINAQEANNIAKQIMETQKPVEKFYNDGYNNMPSLSSMGSMGSLPEKLNSIINQYDVPATFANKEEHEHQYGNSEEHKQQGHQQEIKAPFVNMNGNQNMKSNFENKNNIAPFSAKVGKFTDYDDNLENSENDFLGSYPDVFGK